MKRMAVAMVLGLMAGCGGSPEGSIQQGVGNPNGGAPSCSPVFNVSVSGGVVYATLSQAFNAWKSDNSTLTLSGTVTDTCGTSDTFSSPITGSWALDAGSNQDCSNNFSGNVALPAVEPNHWHNVNHCDGSVEVVGCQSAKTIAVTVNLDGPGQNDFTGTGSASVPAVQDADVYDTCTSECDIGECVSACQKSCARGDKACGTCCECRCKYEGRQAGNLACSPQPLCYAGNEGGREACLAF